MGRQVAGEYDRETVFVHAVIGLAWQPHSQGVAPRKCSRSRWRILRHRRGDKRHWHEYANITRRNPSHGNLGTWTPPPFKTLGVMSADSIFSKDR